MNKEISTTKIALFKGKKIRKTIYHNEWWFVINDVIGVLTDTPNIKDYIRKMRIRDRELRKGWRQFVAPLFLSTFLPAIGFAKGEGRREWRNPFKSYLTKVSLK